MPPKEFDPADAMWRVKEPQMDLPTAVEYLDDQFIHSMETDSGRAWAYIKQLLSSGQLITYSGGSNVGVM